MRGKAERERTRCESVVRSRLRDLTESTEAEGRDDTHQRSNTLNSVLSIVRGSAPGDTGGVDVRISTVTPGPDNGTRIKIWTRPQSTPNQRVKSQVG